MKYSPELAQAYSDGREKYNETDAALFAELDKIGVKEKTVIDLGCGDGRHAEEISRQGAANVLGIDVNEKMIENAKLKSKDGLGFAVANGQEIPVADDSADIVFSNFVLHYFKDSKKVFGEIARVLKNNGHFVGTFNITDVKKGHERLINQEMPIRLGQRDSSIVVENLIKSRADIEEAIRTAGLQIESEQELNHPNAVVDDSFPDKDKIEKHAVMMVLKKIDKAA